MLFFPLPIMHRGLCFFSSVVQLGSDGITRRQCFGPSRGSERNRNLGAWRSGAALADAAHGAGLFPEEEEEEGGGGAAGARGDPSRGPAASFMLTHHRSIGAAGERRYMLEAGFSVYMFG